MAFLLATLGPRVAPDRRVILARGERSEAAVGGAVATLPPGTVVLLHGVAPPWTAATTIRDAGWPPDLPPLPRLWSERGAPVRHAIRAALSSWGPHALDSRGHPCEIGVGRSGGALAYVLNYTGWRIADFPDEPVEVLPCGVGDRAVWIVPPTSLAAPVPAHERGVRSFVSAADLAASVRLPMPHAPPPPTPARSAPPPTPQAAGPARPAPVAVPTVVAPPPRPFSSRVRFRDVDFADGSLTVPAEGRRLPVPCDAARAIYQALRAALDEEAPEGLHVVGTVDPDGDVTVAIRGMEILDRLFERTHRRVFVREARASAEWLDADGLAERLPGGGGRRDPASLVGVEGLGLELRPEALRRLFALRDRDAALFVLPGRAALVPLPARDRGPGWYAWETVADGYATYLFRPMDPAARARLLDWSADPASTRQELRRDRDLQAALGFVTRVLHHGAPGVELHRWWARLREVVGAPVEPERSTTGG